MIFVIVILGILGTLSSEILLKMYQTFVMEKGVQNIEVQLKTTLEQLGKYTENAIKPSIVFNNNGTYQDIGEITTKTAGKLDSANKLYMWIGKDIESMQGIWNGSRVYPAYSGLADLKNSSGAIIITTDCNLSNVDDIVENITGKTDITANGSRSALYFVYGNSSGTVKSRFWDNNPSSLFAINAYNENNLTLNISAPEIGDIYYLAYSAYAVKLEGSTLKLIWNFRPWENQTYSNGSEHIIAENITKFYVWSESGGSLIRFYICATDSDIKVVGGNDNWEYCKESVVLR